MATGTALAPAHSSYGRVINHSRASCPRGPWLDPGLGLLYLLPARVDEDPCKRRASVPERGLAQLRGAGLVGFVRPWLTERSWKGLLTPPSPSFLVSVLPNSLAGVGTLLSLQCVRQGARGGHGRWGGGGGPFSALQLWVCSAPRCLLAPCGPGRGTWVLSAGLRGPRCRVCAHGSLCCLPLAPLTASPVLAPVPWPQLCARLRVRRKHLPRCICRLWWL